MRRLLCIMLTIAGCSTNSKKDADDSYLWLEQVEGQRALQWVKSQNAQSLRILEKDRRYKSSYTAVEKILNAKDRLALVSQGKGWLYNFWQDSKHVRGILRRTTLDEYKKTQPRWNILLDLDKLSKREKENWVWKGMDMLPDDSRLLLKLSRGGTDASVTREFDPMRKQFVSNGLHLSASKHAAIWFDKDTLLVGSDFLPNEKTQSGYPRVIKIWKRGQAFSDANIIFEGDEEDVSVRPFSLSHEDGDLLFVNRALTFYESEVFWVGPNNKLTQLPIPNDSEVRGIFKNQLLCSLRSDFQWEGQVYKAGSVVSFPWETLKEGKISNVNVLFEPTETTTFGHVAISKDVVYYQYIDNVIAKGVRASWNNGWVKSPILLPGNGTLGFFGADIKSHNLFATYENYVTPTTLYLIEDKKLPLQLKALPSRFESLGVKVEQRFAVSKDGTRIPYFIAGKDLTRPTPTLLYGYGGFEVIMDPSYMGTIGKLWLEKGFVWVEANIRGGGEFGPRWHQAALKTNRQKAFDDFIAVAEDLIRTGVTTPQKLAIQGGSNGGLLVGATFTQRPDLFKAAVCQVPLLDMLRYHKLLAGASWVSEYGSPEVPSEREALLKYSPYHNLHPNQKYPSVFFSTSTKDDRVHPGHARKMVARMKELGQNVLYFENMEGGHSAAANLKQRARLSALQWVYLYQQLVD